MKSEKRTAYLTRDSIMKLLSDEEVARVSTAETALRLLDGDEYIDLEDLEPGVRRAAGTNLPMGRLLPRKAVNDATWTQIINQLSPPPLPPTVTAS